MGTLVRIQIYASGEAQAKAAFRAAFDRIAELDAILSDYRPDSELNRLPRQPGPDLFRVLEAAQQLARGYRMARSTSPSARVTRFGARRAGSNACPIPRRFASALPALRVSQTASRPRHAHAHASMTRRCGWMSAASPKGMRPTRRWRC